MRTPIRRSGPLLATCLAFALGIGGDASAQSAQAGEPGYGIRPGDHVTTDFFTAAGERLSVITGTRTVDRHGHLYLPYVGTVVVEGLDASGIRERLQEVYAGFYLNPVVDVSVELRVNVTGAIRAPGNYYVSPTSTIIDILSLAGGVGTETVGSYYAAEADPSDVRLVRDGRTIVLDVRPEHATEEVLTMRIQSGDWIFVPPRSRSRLRQEIQFWGSLVSLVGSVIALGFLISN